MAVASPSHQKAEWRARPHARRRQYLAETISDADYLDDLVLPANTLPQTDSQLHNLEQAAKGISLYMNSDKIEFMCFNQDGVISSINGPQMKLIDLGRNISSIQSDIDVLVGKAWAAIDRLTARWKFDLLDKMKRNFF